MAQSGQFWREIRAIHVPAVEIKCRNDGPNEQYHLCTRYDRYETFHHIPSTWRFITLQRNCDYNTVYEALTVLRPLPLSIIIIIL